VSVAVDTRARIERALPEVVGLGGHGLVTLERARLLVGRVRDVRFPQPQRPGEETKLTIYLGRRERAALASRSGDRPAFLAVVDLLHRHGVAGATVLLGVDGTAVGFRQRARFFSSNAGVPLMIISVGSADAVARALPQLGSLLERPLLTLERIRVCKRDGQRLAEPDQLPDADPLGLGIWQKLMVYAGEHVRHGGHPLYLQLIRRLREAGASGATVLRGVWGYHGDHAPHGDRLLALRRRVPVLTVIVDTPSRIRRWFAIVDELTEETGLVTCEIIPAFRETGPGVEVGGLRLASRLTEE
jgi:PII-like signaling protein